MKQTKPIEAIVEEIKLWRPVFYGKPTPKEIAWLTKSLTTLVQQSKKEKTFCDGCFSTHATKCPCNCHNSLSNPPKT